MLKALIENTATPCGSYSGIWVTRCSGGAV
jgi:hypothetical protein